MKCGEIIKGVFEFYMWMEDCNYVKWKLGWSRSCNGWEEMGVLYLKEKKNLFRWEKYFKVNVIELE